jgi:hypothetical protein
MSTRTRIIGFIAALAMSMAIVPVASADALFLGKKRARAEATQAIRDVAEFYYLETDWATDYGTWVEGNKRAYRNSRTKVTYDTQFTLYDDADPYAVTCDVKIRVWKYRDGPFSELVVAAFQLYELNPEIDCFESEYVAPEEGT